MSLNPGPEHTDVSLLCTRVLAFMNCENKQHQPIHSFIHSKLLWEYDMELQCATFVPIQTLTKFETFSFRLLKYH